MSLSTITTNDDATRQERSFSVSSTASATSTTSTSSFQPMTAVLPTHAIARPTAFLELTPPLSTANNEAKKLASPSTKTPFTLAANFEERQRLLLLRARDN